MKYPFEASLDEIEANPEPYIDAVFSSLESEFLILPKGDDFLDYPQFERAYKRKRIRSTACRRQIPRRV